MRKQILFTEIGKAELQETDLPAVKENDAAVKTEYTVISGGTERASLPSRDEQYLAKIPDVFGISRRGADYAFDPTCEDFAENVKRVTKGKGVNGCVEVTGVSSAMNAAPDCAAFMGRIALLGCTRNSDCSVDYYRQVHRPGIKLIGAHNFVRPQFESYPHH